MGGGAGEAIIVCKTNESITNRMKLEMQTGCFLHLYELGKPQNPALNSADQMVVPVIRPT